MNKKFRIGDLFDIHPTKAYKLNNYELFATQGVTPVLSNSSSDNGIGGYCGLEPTEEGKIITFSDTTTGADTMFYQSKPFIGYPHVQGMYPHNYKVWNEKRYLYVISSIRKASGSGWSYAVKFNRALVCELMVELPVIESSDPNHEYTVDDIDWQYMEDRIKELEEDRIKELEAYLKATNLDDYELTDEDKKVLSLSRKSASNENGSLETDCEDGALRFKEFNIGASYTMRGKTIDVDKDGLFNIVPTKIKINAINIEFNGKYPYVARGEGKNGIRGYIDYDEQYLNEANTISFGQDTATVNYQSHRYFTGDKIQVFKLNKKYGNLTEDKAIYLINSIKKVFERFLWGQQSYALDIISKIKITLPVALDGNPDFDYMERYIKAIKKLTIANVVKYKDNVIDTTKKLVNSQS